MEEGFLVQVDFPSEKISKKMKFNLTMTVAQARQEIIKKRSKTAPIKAPNIADYGLFIPPSYNMMGEWMNDTDPLNYYYVEKRGVIEFKMRPQPLTIKDFERPGVQETLDVDYSVSVDGLMFKISKQLNMPLDAPEYGLLKPGSDSSFLDLDQSLIDQGVPYKSTVTIRKIPEGLDLLGKAKGALQNAVATVTSVGTTGGGIVQKRSGDSKVFGAPMADVLRRTGSQIVPIIQKSVDYIEKLALDTEGIFRMSGSAAEIAALKKQYDDGEEPIFGAIQDPHVVCGLLKLYLRELPDPLFPYSLYDVFIGVQAYLDKNAQTKYYKVLMQECPKENQVVLKRLFQFMKNIVDHSSKNKMAIHNVATVFAPNLLRPQGADIIIEDTAATNAIVCHIIGNYEAIFNNTGKHEFSGAARALSEYRATKETELDFRRDSVIFVTKSDDGDWWHGEVNGRSGSFPNNYAAMLVNFTEGNPKSALPAGPAGSGNLARGSNREDATPSRPARPAQPPGRAPLPPGAVSLTAGPSPMSISPSAPKSNSLPKGPPNRPNAQRGPPSANAMLARPGYTKVGNASSFEDVAALRKGYEEEKKARQDLEKIVQTLAATVTDLKGQIASLSRSNQDLINKM
eukprot:TRINITY_DN6519_c0_g1_i1.p1 TRINITY_DN6519_c0_g1~~TRINITY_DN6519_c0_g1_i1.p1  ORF type:complete len:626 (+),score=172.26 TRINITY_DN6519_c0_g1_i1:122-1999(+)